MSRGQEKFLKWKTYKSCDVKFKNFKQNISWGVAYYFKRIERKKEAEEIGMIERVKVEDKWQFFILMHVDNKKKWEFAFYFFMFLPSVQVRWNETGQSFFTTHPNPNHWAELYIVTDTFRTRSCCHIKI